jgi:very-short-patch-repair endonuclease
MNQRTIGVVSLSGDHQSLKIWEMIEEELGLDAIRHFQIACGDARTFQGKERDVIFLSMVVTPGHATALSRDIFAQRFNVAASRARDRMYLVRSIGSEDLSEADKLRRGLISHFASPFQREETRYDNLRLRCETTFERALYDALVERGYRVVPQMAVGNYDIDLVVEGHNDNRIAIECDGDRHSGPESWDDDMRQQRVLERAGWRFWRCFASAYIMHPEEVFEDLIQALRNAGIEPIGANTMPEVTHVEHRSVIAIPSQPAVLFGKTDALLGRIAAG